MAERLEDPRQRRGVLAGQQVGRCQQGSLPAGVGDDGHGDGRDRGLARPDVALEQTQHRPRGGQVGPDGSHGRLLVAGQLDGGRASGPRADLLGERRFEGTHDGRQSGVVGFDRLPGGAPSLAIASDHADLQGEQLVEGEPAESQVLVLRVVREVRVLDGPGDARGAGIGRWQIVRPVFRVARADLVERSPDGPPQDPGRDALGQSVDGHDPAGIEQLAVGWPEDRTLEDGDDRLAEAHRDAGSRRRPLDLDLAGDDHLLAGQQASLDVLTAEPDRLGAAAVVLQPGPDAVDPSPHRRLDGDVDDADPGRDRLAGRFLGQPPEWRRRPEVVVSAGQVEEQVADRLDAQTLQAPGDRR